MALLVKEKVYFDFLKELPNEVLVEFCKLSLEYLNKGPNHKKYGVASDKLSKTSDFIQSTVEALVFFQIECLKSNISETEFESVSSLGFNQNQIEILWQFIKNKEENLKTLISADNQLHFRDLEWRLEARISSRALLYQATPILTVKLHLDQEILTEIREKLNDIPELSKSTQRQVLMHMDPSSLSHAIESLENALLASKTHRTRCFCKAFQSSQ